MTHKELAKLCWDSYYEREDFGIFTCKWAFLDDTIYCAFTGSDDKVDWIYNTRLIQADSEIPNFVGRCHIGYMDLTIDVAKCIRMVMNGRYKGINKMVLTGHSLGGALSIMTALRLREFNPTVVSFGAPKIFDKEGARNYDVPATHYMLGTDPFPHMPRMGYSYYKNTIWLNKPPRIINWIRSITPITSFVVGAPEHFIPQYYNAL